MAAQVVVVGGGISGLVAAKTLVESGCEVTVLEANDRVGGRTHTTLLGDDPADWVDLGGSYVGVTQDAILNLLDELELETYELCNQGDLVFYYEGRINRYSTQWPTGFWWNVLGKWDLWSCIKKLDQMCSQVDLEAPWNSPFAAEWDKITLEEWLLRNCWTRFARGFVRANCQTSVTADPWQCSLLWFLHYHAAGGGMYRIWNGENGAQERKIKGGTQQISERLVQKIGQGKESDEESLADRVLLSTPVLSIDQRNSRVTVVSKDGRKFECDYVVVAVPLPMANRIVFEPNLPHDRVQLIQRAAMGCCIKSNLYYEKPFWREKGFMGFMNGIDPGMNTMDDTRPECEQAAITTFTFCTDAMKELMKGTKEQRKLNLGKILSLVFRDKRLEQPLRFTEKAWMQESYIGGCYSVHYPPAQEGLKACNFPESVYIFISLEGVMTSVGHCIRDPVGRVHWAGTETSSKWCGYMDGAVRAGKRAGREILVRMGKLPSSRYFEPEHPRIQAAPIELGFFERHPPSVGKCLALKGNRRNRANREPRLHPMLPKSDVDDDVFAQKNVIGIGSQITFLFMSN
ncbi:unnamed protein product [Cyprideis torosa]|uniref:Amine oxidase n=1 Tax=Cyprideis torosa TaxID=163714 RepID=A0A7R8ZJI3_9CRUS|nr:unnamed protein product [Cyprideis torosa]CAG0879875.1 unnamed protein product [Cyprideis torosa]